MTNVPAPGIYAGITNEDYHLGPGESSTTMKPLLRSALHFHTAKSKETRETLSQLVTRDFGSAVHILSLDPSERGMLAVVPPNLANKRKKDYQDWAKAAKAENRIILTEEEMALARACAGALMMIPEWDEWTAGGLVEHSIYWEENGHLYKARPDIWFGTTLLDVKTTDDARKWAFEKIIAKMKYHFQLGFYERACMAHGYTISDYGWLVVETNGTPAAQVLYADQDMIDTARREVDEVMALHHHCLTMNEWLAYDLAPQTVRLPGYYN